VYAAVIHDDNRVWARIFIYLIKEALDELCKASRCEGTLHDVNVKDAIEGECWQNGVSTEQISSIMQHLDLCYLPFPSHKTCFRRACCPLIAHACPWYIVRQSAALLSTKTSCSLKYWPILAMYSAHFMALHSMATHIS
jgi:hypothetical protein